MKVAAVFAARFQPCAHERLRDVIGGLIESCGSQAPALQALTQGQVVTDTFTYTISDHYALDFDGTNDYVQLLSEFRSRWYIYHGGVQRDVAHLFTAKKFTNGVIGVAYLNSILSLPLPYRTMSRSFLDRESNDASMSNS